MFFSFRVLRVFNTSMENTFFNHLTNFQTIYYPFNLLTLTMIITLTFALSTSAIVHKVDDVACRQFLDRFESFCPTLKESSTEELLGPTANRALNLAETCAGYVLPKEVLSVLCE